MCCLGYTPAKRTRFVGSIIVVSPLHVDVCMYIVCVYMNDHVHRAPFSDIERSSKELKAKKGNSHIYKLLNYTTTSTA